MADKLRLAPIPVPPGETLKEQLEIIGMKQKDLAIRLDMSDKHVNQIINGKAPLLPDTAIKLQSVLGIPSEFWLKLEMRYQNAIAQMKLLEIGEEEKEIAKKIEYSQIASLGWVEPTRKIEEKVQNLKEYFRVADLSIIPRVAANFRKSTAFEASDYALAVWLRKGELIAQDIVVKQYSKSKLKRALPVLRSFTKREPDSFVDEMQALLAECGVAMALVPHLKHTHVNGATKWINREKVLLQVSLKGKYADVFWFTSFHEIGHILFEHSRKEILIDDDQISNEKETQANEFASGVLIPSDKYNYWIAITDLTAENILKFAEEIDIDPGIVVGRLQHDKYLKPYEHNELRRKFEMGEDL